MYLCDCTDIYFFNLKKLFFDPVCNAQMCLIQRNFFVGMKFEFTYLIKQIEH